MKLKNGLTSFTLLIFTFLFQLSATERTDPVQILYFGSGNSESPWTVSVENGFRTALKQREQPYDLYVEYFDAARFGFSYMSRLMLPYIENKYKPKSIDFLIATDLVAAKFVFEHPDLLPDAQRIFIEFDIPETDRRKIDYFINLTTNYSTMVDEIVRLVSPKQIYVIGDTNNKSHLTRIQPLIEHLNKGEIPFSTLVNLSVDELRQAVSNLPKDSAVIYLPISRVKNGNFLYPLEVLRFIEAETSAPIFSRWENMIGSGIVGGYLLSGDQLGQIAVKAIRAATANKKFEYSSDESYGYFYDWNKVRQWGLERNLRPEGTIRYRPPSFLSEYSFEIIVLIIFFILTLLFIATLLLTIRRLRVITLVLKKQKTMLHLRGRKYRKAKNEAESANRLKSEFLANISHELRTPMHHILNYSRLGLRIISEPDSKLSHYLENIVTASQNMTRLINDLFDVSTLEAGSSNFNITENDISDLVCDIMTRLNAQAKKKHLNLSFEAPEFSTTIPFDRAAIDKVLQNILINAIQFSPEKSTIIISLSIHTSDLEVSVTDEGPGIPEDELDYIFDTFTQSSKTKTGAGGTGLGLAICKKIIEKHKGRVWAKNNPQGGTTVTFSLPFD